jgi:hypothetical protein
MSQIRDDRTYENGHLEPHRASSADLINLSMADIESAFPMAQNRFIAN